MTTETSSSTSLDCLIYKGNSSFADCSVQLHFCELGLKKLSQLLRKNPHASPHGCAKILDVYDSNFSLLMSRDWLRYEGIEVQGVAVPPILCLMRAALQRFHQAWIECHVMPVPSTGYVVLLGSTIHLIVECEPGTTLTIKGMSAECLVFFNGPGSGLSRFHQ